MVRRFLHYCWRFSQGLRFKLSFYTGLIVFLSIVVFAYHSISLQEENIIKARMQGAINASDVIRAALRNAMMADDRKVIGKIVESIGNHEDFQEINIFDADRVLHYTSNEQYAAHVGKLFDPDELSPLMTNLDSDKTKRYKFDEQTNVVTVVNPILNTPSCSTAQCHAHPADKEILGALEVKFRLKGLRSGVSQNAEQIIYFAGFLFLLISSVIGIGVIFLVSRPIERLRRKAQRIAGGDYTLDEPAGGSDSIAELSRSLDEMSRKIRERETEIDQRRRMYQDLFEKVPCYLIVVDQNYRITRANQAFINAFGDQVYKNCFSAFKNRDSKCPDCQVELTFRDCRNHRSDDVWNLKNSNGNTHVIIHTTPILDNYGRAVEVLEMAVDVTALVELKEEIRKKEEQFRDLLSNIPCYLTVIDNSFRIGYFNKMFESDFGNRWGEKCFKAYKGRTEKCENCPVEKTFQDGNSHYSEEIWTLGGEDRHIVVRTAPMLDTNGRIMAVMEMCTNVTELKILENRLAILGETIAGTSHAIKNILSGLEGGVYITDSGLKAHNPDRVSSGWKIVKKNVDLVSELVKDILYASKERTPDLKSVNPGQVINEVVELFSQKAESAGISLVKDVADFDLGLFDPAGMHNVLSNLISNAVSACSEHTADGPRQIEVKARNSGDTLVIEVSDTGGGMSEDVKKNLFKKFFSTKGAKGTGLGLLVSRKIVEENGGTITCESRLGEGTKFMIRLPFRRVQDAK